MLSFSESHSSPPFHLDESVTVRDVSFKTLRNLLVRIRDNQPLSYTDIVEHPIAELKDVWGTESEQELKRSPRYHHLNALKILDLVKKIDKGYVLTEAGHHIASSHLGADASSLSVVSKRFFREAIRSCAYVHRNFFLLFTGNLVDDPWQRGAPVSIHPIAGQRTYDLTCPNWPGKLRLSKKQTHGVIWGIRHWCQQVDIIDELFIRPQEGIHPEDANIMFLVDSDRHKDLSIGDFGQILRRYVALQHPVYGDTVSISIPLLFYRMCPSEQMNLDTAKELLAQWLKKYSSFAFAEAPTYIILEQGHYRRGSAPIVWQKQEDAFLKLGSRYYSRLFISKSVWQEKEG